MKLLIVGSRSITSFDLSPYISDETDLIISGGASGVDALAERYADEHAIGVVGWFEFDSKVIDEQQIAVLTMHSA